MGHRRLESHTGIMLPLGLTQIRAIPVLTSGDCAQRYVPFGKHVLAVATSSACSSRP